MFRGYLGGIRGCLGRCRLKHVETSVESAWLQCYKLEYDESLSNPAFNFSLRPLESRI